MPETAKEPIWLIVQPPIGFHLTTTGSLTIEFDTILPEGVRRVGIEIPAEGVPTLRRGLEATRTTQEMLSVKPPEQGAH